MDIIDRDTLVKLASRTGWPSVSLYMPAHRLRTQTDSDRILLRNLIKDARGQLVAQGMREREADALLASASALAADDAEWTGGFDGLAIFASSDVSEVLRLGAALPEVSVVGDRLYLRPLYRALRSPEKFWALAIDLKHTRLFRGDHSGVEEVALPDGTPTSLADALRFDEREESLQYHTVPGATPEGAQGVTTALFHGHGGEKDVDHAERTRFMQELDRGVTATLGAQCADPLVLLGVGYLLADYRDVNSYPHLLQEHVEGATDEMIPRDVHLRALAVLEPRHAVRIQADVDELRQLSGTDHASEDPAQILSAAAAGRVKTLFFGDGAGPWGWFDRTTFDVTHLCPAKPATLREDVREAEGADPYECGWDLVDLAAAETVLHRGAVHAFTGEDAPVGGVAAVFRY